jgi:pyruvate,orthophosphate dikinase
MGIITIGGSKTQPASAENIGAKAAILAEIAALGLPVPPAFVLPISLGARLIANDKEAKKAFHDDLAEGIAFLEEVTGKRFGDRRCPLLVSVRSGAAKSMPGMLDTVLNIGCTNEATRGLIRISGNPRLAWDCRRRLLEGYAETVLGLDIGPLLSLRDDLIRKETAESDRDLDSEALERLALAYATELADLDAEVPDDPMQQLTAAARAVYRSWTSERARTYRRLQGLEHLQGTAVMVQAIVFGNKGASSGAGVAFSRDPSTGASEPVIDILFEAQGEDVVSGQHTPKTEKDLSRSAPALAAELRRYLVQLERHFKDVQDIEFTIEEGKLWILQSRAAKRTARAALRIAVAFVHEGLLSEQQALQRLEGLDLQSFAIARFADAGAPVAHGIGAAGGVAVGRATFDSAMAERMKSAGDPVVLIRSDINTADVAGIAASAGLVTATGGRTAHASLIARQMDKPCVVSCVGLEVDSKARRAQVDGVTIQDGDWLSISGDTGEVFLGQREILRAPPEAELAEVERWRARPASKRDDGREASVG